MKYLLLMILLALPVSAQAQEDWSGGAGVHPMSGLNLNHVQPVQHQVHMNVTPQAPVQPQHHVQPVENNAQAARHDKPAIRRQITDRRKPDDRKAFYRNEGFYSGNNDNFPYVTVSPAIDLPDGLDTVIVDGQTFFYSDGIFYQEVGGQLTVIPPVLGAVVDSIPQDYKVVMADGVNYFYAEGVFYQRVEQGFEVVQPPVTDQE